MSDLIIFIVGCSVFAVTIASAFIYLIASDDPAKRDEREHSSATSSSA